MQLIISRPNSVSIIWVSSDQGAVGNVETINRELQNINLKPLWALEIIMNKWGDSDKKKILSA